MVQQIYAINVLGGDDEGNCWGVRIANDCMTCDKNIPISAAQAIASSRVRICISLTSRMSVAKNLYDVRKQVTS